MTNSVGILSDALESTVNVITGFITLKSLHWASKPQDEDHPYGNGKIELITASLEGILIGVAGTLIIIEALQRLGTPTEIIAIDLGIVLLLVTAIINYLMGRYSISHGKKNKSVSLTAGGKHLISDAYTTLALVSGLTIFYFTGFSWVDSLLGVIFGIFILYTAYGVLKETVTGLLDEADVNTLHLLAAQIISKRNACWVNIHKLTYLKFGHISHVDLHLTLPWYYDVRQSTEEITQLKKIIRINLPEDLVEISVQSEPCITNMCSQCDLDCSYRKYNFMDYNQWTTEKITGKNKFTYE